ncbi:MAG: hypothetical protein M3270_09130 [Thermoproteota archaeon]|nr:hypothetical protein [Thermoproteota archaeon]
MHCRNCRGISIQDDGVKTQAQKLLETTRKNYGRLYKHSKYLYSGAGIAGSSEGTRRKESKLNRAVRLAPEEAEDDKYVSRLASAIEEYLHKLPSNIREKLLLRLADNEEAIMDLPFATVWNFDKLPPNVQQPLFKLAEDDRTPESVAYAIWEGFNMLPPNIREKLLLKLAENDKAVPLVVNIMEGINLSEDISDEILAKIRRRHHTGKRLWRS